MMWILACRILCCGGNGQIHTDYRNPVEKKGQHGHSRSEREREGQREPKKDSRPPPGQAFIAFLGTLYRGWSSLTVHRFTVGDYLLQITKERMLLITSKRRMFQMQGEKWLNWLHSILGRFSTDFRKLNISSKHLLPQSKVREFQRKQVSKQPRYNAGLIPHGRTYPWAWVLCVGPHSPLAHTMRNGSLHNVL